MTAPTVTTEFPVVHVIAPMAIGALLTERHLRGQRLPVTTLARDLGVRTLQPEVRLRIVVEQPLLPVDRVVAQHAIASETTFMRVVFLMAVHTFR